MPAITDSIIGLRDAAGHLPADVAPLFERIYRVTVSTGRLVAPDEMKPWIEERFGSADATTTQDIVRVNNLVTLEAALFNALRARRPMEAQQSDALEDHIYRNIGDALCRVEIGTPADTFGRVRGKYCITASNIAKFAAHHCLIVFDRHNPLAVDAEVVADYIDTAYRWAEAAHNEDPEARYFFFLWNCLWRAGASLVHGHAQAMLAREMHYAKVESLRRSALQYAANYGSNYFADLVRVHEAVGAGFTYRGIKVLAHLTPLKENEVLLIGDTMTPTYREAIGDVLITYLNALNVESFNMAIHAPPLWETDEDWSGFPTIVRIVDRGSVDVATSDFGGMELYGTSVVESDPLHVSAALRDRLT